MTKKITGLNIDKLNEDELENMFTNYELVDIILGYREQIKQLKKQVKDLTEWKEANKPTGICETCTDKTLQLNDKYREAFKQIKYLINKIDDSNECIYGDYNCENCSPLGLDTVCSHKIKNTILKIIDDIGCKNESN